ncbi:aminotransferase class I/II-fold pyridoxal phosphate-dependent enzyme [Marinihelvus fidelis]|uniref:Aminotransferase class I/II-fold pyridoxal phosphate-dependent enzyme n=1 Tax=Marinihelvus fidelis TaxID=2613842 RepID=A0A5N0T4A6_9GAMM|nr:DegT/DnrJ/EryC1/StrS family aminotransferase [Marinihelvus fidelis]KAA9129743.1 aminotransferase class I/II-fold pyridoxal phosphate-dependent enzyme [Marinihelvus fidelis]
MNSEKTLHVGSPNIGELEAFWERAQFIFQEKWLTNRGKLVQQFERELAKFLGVKHCISMCNGTVALEIAIRALSLEGEVILPSFTFIATAHALQWQEITPVFCDISPDTFCIDPCKIESLINPKTSAIVGVHVFSRPCDVDALQRIADRHGLKLLFDAAHAFGCSYGAKTIGGFGNCEVFSFHATKFFNSFEGGAVTTNDDQLAEKIRLMQNFGFAGYDNVVHIGTNGKMTEICAAMGLTNLENIDSFLRVNKRNYDLYREKLSGLKGLELMCFDEAEKCNWQYIVVEVEETFPLTRDKLMEKLHRENVVARRYFWPGCHRMQPYRSKMQSLGQRLSITESLSSRLLVLPTGTAVGPDDISRVCRLIAECN